MKLKPIKWLGSAYKDLLAFSKAAKSDVGYQLDKVQRGEAPSDWKPMHNIGMNVKEIRIYAKNQYRVIYVANYADYIYVLHCFVKKTQQTRKSDIDIAKTRFKEIKFER